MMSIRVALILGDHEIEVDIILVRTAAADRVRFGHGDLAHGEERDFLIPHERLMDGEGVPEEAHLDPVDEHGQLVDVIDER